MKILIPSDGKYGDRAEVVIRARFPETRLWILPEETPGTFLEEVAFPPEFEAAVADADLVISYVRHPDVVAEMCALGKPFISAIYLGPGFLRQLQRENPRAVMPRSMCLLEPDTGIPEIDAYARVFGLPAYDVKIRYTYLGDPVFDRVTPVTASPCGASTVGAQALAGQPVSPETINQFALVTRQECREPQSLLFQRDDIAESATATHARALLAGIKNAAPDLFRAGTTLRRYAVERFPELPQTT